MELNLNGTDVLQPGDKGYNGDTDGAYLVEAATSVGIDLRHEVTGELIAKMSHRESYDQDWRWFRDPAATTTTVAQAISLVVDEAQEGLLSDEVGVFLGDNPIRITEVSAELANGAYGDWASFTVKTSDGQEFEVRVTPKRDQPLSRRGA